MTRFNEAMREKLAKDSVGKVIEALEYYEDEDYYSFTFTDGTEMAFRFMADLVTQRRGST